MNGVISRKLDAQAEGTLARVLLMLALLALCSLIIKPFIPALAWAIALAVVSRPLSSRLRQRFLSRNVSSLITVLVVGSLAIVPALLILWNATEEALVRAEWLRHNLGPVTALVRKLGTVPFIANNLESITAIANRFGGTVVMWLSSILSGSVQAVTSALISMFVLFFFIRDGDGIISAVKRYVPFSEQETDVLLRRVGDTIIASLFGRFAAAAAQGLMGGLMFAILGIQSPALWGFAMAMVSVIPMLGPFVVWIPAAILLAIQGHPAKCCILIVWGVFVVGLIDNLVYPMIVGGRLRLHTLLLFFSILGGIAVFGFSGIVLGPTIVSLTLGVADLMRSTTSSTTRRDPPAVVGGSYGSSSQEQRPQVDAVSYERPSH